MRISKDNPYPPTREVKKMERKYFHLFLEEYTDIIEIIIIEIRNRIIVLLLDSELNIS